MAATPDGALIINALPTGNELVEVWRGNMLVAYPASAILGASPPTVSGVTPRGALICRGVPTGEEVLECWVNGNSRIAYRLSAITGTPSGPPGRYFTPSGTQIVNSAPTGNELFECWSGNTLVSFSVANLIQGAGVTYAPRVWGYIGDSYTFMSNAGSTALAFPAQSEQLAGTRNISMSSVISGIGGQRCDQISARVPAMLPNVGAMVYQGGMNDVLQGVSDATFIASVKVGLDLIKASGKPCVVVNIAPTYVATSPSPFDGSVYITNIKSKNALLAALVATYGPRFVLADIFTALTDPLNGDMMKFEYNRTAADAVGDGVHPGPYGHYEIGRIVALAQMAAMAGLPQIVDWSTLPNLLPNSLNTGAGPLPTNGTSAKGGSSTQAVYSIVDDVSGFLPAGRWLQMDIDSGANISFNRAFLGAMPALNNGWAVGDVLAFGGYVQIEDVSGVYRDDLVDGLAYVQIGMWRNGAAQFGLSLSGPNNGPMLQVVTVPAATTSLQFALDTRVKAGVRTKFRIGQIVCYNLTALGLAGTIV